MPPPSLRIVSIALSFFILALVLLYTFGIRSFADVRLLIAPDAESLYVEANSHFDAQHADNYDLKRAESLYRKALVLDPSKVYVRHQLARIEFLRSNFGEALRLINEEIALPNGPASPSTYYIKGLIEGFAGDYAASAKDYETYLRTDSTNWAAINDYAWVLLKADRPLDALVAVDWGLITWPENPWLLNTRATALFELGYIDLAYDASVQAGNTVIHLTESDWLEAYPGNDPLIAAQGLAAFKKAVEENMHTITIAHENAHKDVQ